ncbi:SpoIIE family protein phosphatase [Streptomyces sp. SAJ15]|uniref:SpoIIE family protein phosphatase n=1 Tax=Streptomyces sp. SAJ15 TaxID=2011095 RepID=UPI001186EE3A|nr:SpoIIE family protein phosphatase [Streptomyces sp. SAJ15]TVL91628.1 phosphatase [Streptomyces sp. SAJ15]
MSGRGESPEGVESLDEVLADTVRRTGASAGRVYLLDEATRTLGLAVVCGVPLELGWPWRRMPLNAPAPVTDAVREGRLVWVASQEELTRIYPRAAASLPYRFALAAAPLLGRSRSWGTMLLLWPASHPESATRRELGHITAAARRIARVLDEAAAPPVVPDEPRFVPVAGSDAGGGQPSQAAADYAERLPEGGLALDLEGRITFLTATAAALLDRDASQLLGTRPWQSLPWLDDPVVEDHYRTAVISRDPVAFVALRPPDSWLHFELYPDASGISARISRAPAAGRERSRPAGEREPGDPSPTRAAQAGRLFQLVHLAAALTETVAVRDVVELVADQVLPAFGADGLVLSAADAGRLKITGHHGYDQQVIDRLDGLPLDTDLTPAGQVLASGVPSFFASPEEMARRYPRAPQISDKQAWAFLPLLIHGRPVGCCILSYDHPRTFTADERAVLTSLAGLVAQALDRARLYDAAHDLAHGLQQALLPHSLPTVPGLRIAARYLPASHGMDIGGDFYDVIRLDATTVAAVIGDVQGHNVAAAALMGQVRTAIHATAGASPDQVLASTNRVLADLETDLLASCLYVHLDLTRQQATLASAGHPPPFLHRPGRPAEVLALDPGPLLGVDIDISYPVTGLTLTRGMTLALYTDGLIEVPGADSGQIATGLAHQLGDHSDQDLDGLIDRLIHRTWPGGRYTDDIAMLLLRTGPPSTAAASRPGD